jgi:DNA-binding winged helix-turn-helix (wHTH) protein/TolB-like protein
MRNSEKHFYDFGPFRFDSEKHRLSRDGEVVAVPRKATEVLLVLLQNKGKQLEREEFMQAVWGNSCVEDANLTVAISALRKALGQRGDKAEYIETIPRGGYRFVAEVQEIHQKPAPLIVEKHTRSQTIIEEEFLEDAQAPIEKVVTPKSPTRVSSIQRRRRTAAVFAGVTLFSLALGGFVYFKRGDRGIGSGANIRVQSIKSLAVLPPKLLGSDDPSLSLGIADALISKLGGVSKLTLRPTSAISRYVSTTDDSVEVGRALAVDAVLEGTLQREGGRMRLTLQLIDVAHDEQIWTHKFEEADADIFKLEDSVSQQVADVLSLNLTADEKTGLTKHQTLSTEAYASYLKGKYFWNKRGPDIERSREFYHQAIQLDPNFVQAYVGLAEVDATGSSRSTEAEIFVEKALQLDDRSAEAHATLGFIRMFHHWDWARAGKELDRAIELDPNCSLAHHWKGVYWSLLGRLDEAKAEMHRALELDPLSLIIIADIGQLHYFAREYDQAIEYCNKALAFDPQFFEAHVYLRDIYLAKGMEGEAFDHSLAANHENPADPKREYLARGGWKKIARQEVQWNPSTWAKLWNAVTAADKESALAYLDRALAERQFLLPFVNVDPHFDLVRNEPRFKHIVEQMELSPRS